MMIPFSDIKQLRMQSIYNMEQSQLDLRIPFVFETIYIHATVYIECDYDPNHVVCPKHCQVPTIAGLKVETIYENNCLLFSQTCSKFSCGLLRIQPRFGENGHDLYLGFKSTPEKQKNHITVCFYHFFHFIQPRLVFSHD